MHAPTLALQPRDKHTPIYIHTGNEQPSDVPAP